MLLSRDAVTLFILVLTVEAVSAQDYPSKPIRIVTSGAGSDSDFAARQIATALTGTLGQPLVVVNFPNVPTSAENVSKAPPDGYTLLVTASSLWIGPLLQTVPYDVTRDFAPISLLAMGPNILVVHPSLPVKTVKELIALAKSKPGQLNYSSGVSGGSPHLGGELFKAMAGVNITRIPYKSGSERTVDLLNGQVQLTFGNAEYIPYVKAGKLRALGVGSLQPSVLVPGLPPVAATLPGFESVGENAMFAPAKTPEAIIRRINQEVVRFLSQPEVKQKFLGIGAEVVASSPQELAAKVKSEVAMWGKLMKDAGIKGD